MAAIARSFRNLNVVRPLLLNNTGASFNAPSVPSSSVPSLSCSFARLFASSKHKSVVDHIIDDHNVIKRVYDKFNDPATSDDDKQQLA
jgi:hypothetical protein